jgi:prevent-host-death family protein
MPQIRPVSDFRNNFAEISKIAHTSSEPLFLTKNGCDDMVVMSITVWEENQNANLIYQKLREAEIEAKSTDIRLSSEEVFSSLRYELGNKKNIA